MQYFIISIDCQGKEIFCHWQIMSQNRLKKKNLPYHVSNILAWNFRAQCNTYRVISVEHTVNNCLACGALTLGSEKVESSPPITFESGVHFNRLQATAGGGRRLAIITSWRRVSLNFKQKGNVPNSSILSLHWRWLSCGKFNLFVTEDSLAESFRRGKWRICSRQRWRGVWGGRHRS